MNLTLTRLITASISLTCLGVILNGCGSPSVSSLDTSTSTNTVQLATSTTPFDPNLIGSRGELEHQGLTRTYYLYTPMGSSPLPLMIVLHGGTGTGERIANTTGFDQIAAADGFIVVYPDGVDGRWNDGRDEVSTGNSVDDVSFITALIADLSQQYPIDLSQVYVAGISNGGYMTQRLACDVPEHFAGYGVVAASLTEDAFWQDCRARDVGPLLMINGTEDTYVLYEGGTGASGIESRPVENSIRAWAWKNRCSLFPQVTPAPRIDQFVFDGTTVEDLVYEDCSGGAVQLIKIIGGGHTWPGDNRQPAWLVGLTSREVNGSQEIWNFFQEQL